MEDLKEGNRTDVQEAVLMVLEAGEEEDNRELLAELAANLIPLTGGVDNAVHLDRLFQLMDPDKRPEPFATMLNKRIKTIYSVPPGGTKWKKK